MLTTLATAACFRAVSSTYLGEKPTVGESLSFAASRLLPLIWLSILYSFGLIIPFLLLMHPGHLACGRVVAELSGAAGGGRAGLRRRWGARSGS